MTPYTMATKIFFFACLVILTCFPSVIHSKCFKDAVKSVKSEARIGGWTSQSVSDLSDDTQRRIFKYIAEAVKTWNAKSNYMGELQAVSEKDSSNPEITDLFTQVVAGVNYCVKFRAEPYRCKNGVNDVLCTSGEYECELKVYEPLNLLQGTPIGGDVQDIDCTAV